MLFTSKSQQTIDLKLYGSTLEVVKNFKFLGIIFDSKLIWNLQIDYIVTRCKKRINLLRYIVGSNWGPDNKTLLLL